MVERLHPPGPLRAGGWSPPPKVRRRGIEPRPSAWKADILTTELTTLTTALKAYDEIRTRDLHVGNVMHDQLAIVSDPNRY